MTDMDRALRLALFDHVGRLRDELGGVVTAARLNDGMVFQGKSVPIWSQRQGIFKPASLGPDGAALTVHTSYHGGPYDDWADLDSGAVEYRYQGTDPENHFNRAMRNAMRLQRPLLYLVGVQPGVYDAVFPVYIVSDDPSALTFTLLTDAQRDMQMAFDRPVLENIALKEYATRTVKQRIHQRRFRYVVLSAYREQCSMCRLRHTALLDAAHIIPDADVKGVPDVTNGLALCKIHHSAYDVGILGVDPDYRIHLRQDILDEVDGPMLRHGLQEIHGSAIALPRSATKRPNRDYLSSRFKQFLAA